MSKFKFDKDKIPTNCGVYLYYDNLDNIIYIGKAKNLRNRVSSYFSNSSNLSLKTKFLVKNIDKIDFIIVDNELESLLLENKLIKKHKPKYNINLKDNKTYAYIKITNSKIPKIISTRIIKDDGANYFGPFSDGNLRRELIDLVVELFNLITPKTFSSKSRLNFEIGLSPSREISQIDEEIYLKKVSLARDFLMGVGIKKMIKDLEGQMFSASNENKFEIANFKKRQIFSIKRILEKQKVDLIKNFDQDIIVIEKENDSALILLFNILRGTISKKQEFRFDFDDNLFEEFLKMYYSKNCVPKEIIVSSKFWENDIQKKILEDYFSKNRNSKVVLINPKRGERKSLIELARKNAKESLKNNLLLSIKEKLGLPKVPNIIECFDMSNLGNKFQVGAMTRWVCEKEDKDNYRKFEIKSFKDIQDDFRATHEVVFRRYKKLRDENLEFPDLIIIDGGLGQLRFAVKALMELNLKIPIISIQKGAKRDRNDILILGKSQPIILENNSREMLFLRKVRDSVHNLVINYNRKKREMWLKEEFKKVD